MSVPPAPPDRSNGSTDDPGPSLPVRKVLRFRDLATCGDEIWIEHDGQLYRLQQTRQGKLVLTK